MHLGDSIFIFILALVLFGPKKLPEMAKQIGKLMAEFRRASNDFRLQIDEELRTMERQEQQKKQEAERATAMSAAPAVLPPAVIGELTAGSSLPPITTISADAPALQIMPPTLGEQVSAGSPYAVSAVIAEPAEDHPLLQVESIPVDPQADPSQPTGLAAAEANAARLTANGATSATKGASHFEPEQASLNHG